MGPAFRNTDQVRSSRQVASRSSSWLTRNRSNIPPSSTTASVRLQRRGPPSVRQCQERSRISQMPAVTSLNTRVMHISQTGRMRSHEVLDAVTACGAGSATHLANSSAISIFESAVSQSVHLQGTQTVVQSRCQRNGATGSPPCISATRRHDSGCIDGRKR